MYSNWQRERITFGRLERGRWCLLLYSLLLILPPTRPMAYGCSKKTILIELLTFGFLLGAGIRAILLAWQARNHGEGALVYGFYTAFSIGTLFAAMEEVAWGQWFFRFETPPSLAVINMQNGLTIHNIRGLHGHTEFFRVAFGLGGLLGVWISSRRYIVVVPDKLVFLPSLD